MGTGLMRLVLFGAGVTLAPAGVRAGLSLTLAAEGRSDYVIVVSRDAIAPEKEAARELSHYLGRITSAEFAVTGEREAPADKRWIMVGATRSVTELLPEINWPALGPEGIVIQTRGDRILIAGGRPRGTIYAVYTFLEDFAGCRWWTATEASIPLKSVLTIREPDISYVPAFGVRGPGYPDVRDNPGFAVKLKCNAHVSEIPDELGGYREILTYGHSFEQLLPPAKYFENHPEWYSLVKGKRKSAGHSDWQLCLTNLEMRRELTRNVLDKIRENPTAACIFVTQNDGGGQCECAKCRAVTEREASGAGPLLEVVNAVAESVDQEFPGFPVVTFAYTWSRKVPLHVRPRSNVQIWLCGLEGDFAHPIDSEANRNYRDDLASWSKVAGEMVVYHYVAGYGCLVQPHPTLFNIGPDIKFFARHGVDGVKLDADSTPIGDFVRLRAWVFAHMMWDPSRDAVKLIEDFAHGYYGPAGPYVLAYLRLAQRALQRSGMRLFYGNEDSSFFSLDEMNQATQLWDQAEAAVVDDPTVLARVHRERLPLDQVWLRNWARLKRQAERARRPFLGPDDISAACEQYLKKVTEFAGPDYVATRVARGREKCIQQVGIEPNETSRRQLELYAAEPAPIPELRSLSPNQYHVFRIEEEALHGGATLVDDALAASGRAVRLAAPWSQVRLWTKSHFSGRWRIYVRARCEMRQVPDNDGDPGGGYLAPGDAFEVGILDQIRYPHEDYVALQETVSVTRVKHGRYHSHDLGVRALKPAMFIWITNADSRGVSAVHVDTVYLVREGEE